MTAALRLSTLGLAAALALGLAAPAAHACPHMNLSSAPIGGQTEIARDGGLVIVQTRAMGPAERGFTLEAGGAPASYEAEWLAPGLERWKLAGGDAVTVTVGGVTTTVPVVAARGTLRAPAIRAVRSTMARPRLPPHPMGGPNTELTIELAAAPPPGAVALIVYGPRRGEPGRAWVGVDGATTRFRIHGGGKSCGGGPGPSFARERLSFAWLDSRGRLSPRSAPRTVGLGPPTADVD